MSNFRQLLVWQKAHALSLRIDRLARALKRKKPSLAKQIEGAADSVSANIAEGRGRETDADFAHFVSIAIGSVTEVEHHLQRGYDGELISRIDYADLTAMCIQVRRMLSACGGHCAVSRVQNHTASRRLSRHQRISLRSRRGM